jgi:hypothetical protein
LKLQAHYQQELARLEAESRTKDLALTQRFATQQNALKIKHRADLEYLHSRLEHTIPGAVKASSALLNARQVQQSLARQKKYSQV